MEDKGGGESSQVFLASFNGVTYQLNDLVDVFVGTGKGVPGNKAFPIKGRFKGVRVENGEERIWFVLSLEVRKGGVLPFHESLV